MARSARAPAGGLDRREKLIGAARAVARHQGLMALTVRSVASQANVSTGSVLYHFNAFDDLVVAAVDSVLADFAEERLRRAETIDDMGMRISTFVAMGLPLTISDDLRMVYESLAFCRSRPALAALSRSLVERQVQVYFTTIEIGARTGVFTPAMRPVAIARHLVALEDAYDMYPVFGLPQDRQDLRESVIQVAELLLGARLPRDPLED